MPPLQQGPCSQVCKDNFQDKSWCWCLNTSDLQKGKEGKPLNEASGRLIAKNNLSWGSNMGARCAVCQAFKRHRRALQQHGYVQLICHTVNPPVWDKTLIPIRDLRALLLHEPEQSWELQRFPLRPLNHHLREPQDALDENKYVIFRPALHSSTADTGEHLSKWPNTVIRVRGASHQAANKATDRSHPSQSHRRAALSQACSNRSAFLQIYKVSSGKCKEKP